MRGLQGRNSSDERRVSREPGRLGRYAVQTPVFHCVLSKGLQRLIAKVRVDFDGLAGRVDGYDTAGTTRPSRACGIDRLDG